MSRRFTLATAVVAGCLLSMAGWDVCEATGEGAASVQFSRSTVATKEQMVAQAGEFGATVVELDDPALPGAFTYSGVAVIDLDGVEYSTHAITLDTLSDPNSPAAVERSSSLLKAWLTNLGLA